MYVISAATGFAAVGLIALAVLPIAGRGKSAEPAGDSLAVELLVPGATRK
jgi:hypothetical protein